MESSSGSFILNAVLKRYGMTMNTLFVIPANAGIQNMCLDSGFRVKHGMTYSALVLGHINARQNDTAFTG